MIILAFARPHEFNCDRSVPKIQWKTTLKGVYYIFQNRIPQGTGNKVNQ